MDVFDHKKIFTMIYENNTWESQYSVSGPGSCEENTREIQFWLPIILNKFNIKYLFDCPCGDFGWMKHLVHSIPKYLGGDIVDRLIYNNNLKYKTDSTNFITFDICNDKIPIEVDCILVRDLFTHFSNSDIERVIQNILRSNVKYIMTTTYTDTRRNNPTRVVTSAHFRPVNLQMSPFNFPSPDIIFSEHCCETDGLFYDKSIGVWDTRYLKIRNEIFTYNLFL